MKSLLCRSLLVLGFLPIVAGCVDDNYDLSDIDTTVGVTVDQLVIPINLDEITLGNIITIDDDSEVKIVDGKYIIVREGTFDSDPINVPSIQLKAPSISPSETIISLMNPLTPMASRATPSVFSYDLANEGSAFRYESSFVSDFIVRIDHIGCNLTLDINLNISGLEGIANRVTFSDVVLQLPKGLDITRNEGGSYDMTTGELRLPSRTVTGNRLSLQFVASGVDFNLAGGKYDYAGSAISVDGALYIKEGKADIALEDISAGGLTHIPSEVTLRTEYRLSDTNVTSFTGAVRYSIDGSNLTDIDLNSLPDIFSQNATDLTFVNPMIYLKVSNPLQVYGLYARTGLEINAFHGTQSKSYSLDNPWFQIGPDHADGVYNYCLSPSAPLKPEADYSPCTHVGFTQLRNVLSGNGIPDRLQINLTDPMVPTQNVERLPLGSTLGSLHGSYRFIAPLQFGAGSQIIYDHVVDGWSGDDLENLVIYTLEISLDISTDLPVGVKFTGYPVDASGNRIKNVAIVGADIDPMAQNQHVVIKITGEIRHLDGIAFEAHAVATEGQALSPEMSVKLKNIRPKVSGFYEKEL